MSEDLIHAGGGDNRSSEKSPQQRHNEMLLMRLHGAAAVVSKEAIDDSLNPQATSGQVVFPPTMPRLFCITSNGDRTDDTKEKV